MASDQRQWRFFTRLNASDHVVTQDWCWEALNEDDGATSSGAGFTTLPSAMRDARLHGFTGDARSVEGRLSFRRSEDWAPGEHLLPLPFEWLSTGSHDYPLLEQGPQSPAT